MEVDCSRLLTGLPLAACGTTPDLRVRFEEEAAPVDRSAWTELYTARVGDPPTPFWTVLARDDQLCLQVRRFADFVIDRAGTVVRVSAQTGATPAAIDQLLVDLVLPRVLQLRGRACLHASAVKLRSGPVLAFVAPSGSGKSTLCAALTARGSTMLCDDALAPIVKSDGIQLATAYPSVRIWPDSAQAIFASTDFPAATPRLGKLRVERPFADSDHSLDGVLLLSPDGSRARISDVDKLEALAELALSVHRLVADDVPAKAAEFSMLSEIVARVPVRRLHFSHDFSAIGKVAALIEGWSPASPTGRPGRGL